MTPLRLRRLAICLLPLFAAASFGNRAQANPALETMPPGDVPVARAVQPAVVFFPVSHVRLLDGPFKRRYDANTRYLLTLIDPDRLLAPFREHAGFELTKKRYGGWERGGYGGISLGHYLTALAFLHASTGDSHVREQALRRINHIVAELTACLRARSDGAIWPGTHAGGASGRLPFYGIHKLLAGLRDARRLAGAKDALVIERALVDWVESIPPEQIRERIATEYGGMNEVLAELTADTGDPRYLRLGTTMFHRETDPVKRGKNRFRTVLLEPLYRGEDQLGILHANTQIPIVTGLAREYELTGDPRYRAAATSFWRHVVNNCSYVIGGNSESEQFFPPAQFPEKLTGRTCETCNTNNMLKLTRHLFEWEPDAARMDFVERALINHILASIGGKPGEFSYFLPLSSVAVKAFSQPLGAWWCCVGTGMENPAKYGEQIYARDATIGAAASPRGEAGLPALWINHYIASSLDWPGAGLRLVQETRFPDSDTVHIKIVAADSKSRHFTLKLRHPAWCAALEIKINGTPVHTTGTPSSYLALTRDWRDGDTIALRLPMTLRAEPLPHSGEKITALLYGPSVLAAVIPDAPGFDSPAKKRFADFVHARGKTDAPVPHIVAQNTARALDRLRPIPGCFAEFNSNDLLKTGDDKTDYSNLILVPLHRIYEEQYSVYFPVLTPAEWKTRAAQIRAAAQARQKLDAATIDLVMPGNKHSESTHALRAEKSHSGKAYGRENRTALKEGAWFSYEMSVSPDVPVALIATYGWGGIWDTRDFEISIDGHHLVPQRFTSESPGDFKDIAYPIPPSWTRGKAKITVRFTARLKAPALYMLRVAPADAVPADM